MLPLGVRYLRALLERSPELVTVEGKRELRDLAPTRVRAWNVGHCQILVANLAHSKYLYAAEQLVRLSAF